MNTACLICNDANSSATCSCNHETMSSLNILQESSDSIRLYPSRTPVLLTGTPPCIAEGTVLQSSYSYDNLVRPVALRMPLASTNISDAEQQTDMRSASPVNPCQESTIDASCGPLILSTSNSAFTPIRSSGDAENCFKQLEVSLHQQQSINKRISDLLIAPSNTPIHSHTTMDWTTNINQEYETGKLQPDFSYLHSLGESDQMTFCQDKDAPYSDSPLTNRCHSQPCLCRTYECNSALCIHLQGANSGEKITAKSNQTTSQFPVNHPCTLSLPSSSSFTHLSDIQNQMHQQTTPPLSNSSKIRKSKYRLCRHMECGRRRRQSHLTSQGDFLVLSSGRSFLVGLPHFYRSSGGRRSKILADLLRSLTTSSSVAKPYNIINGCLLPTRARAQSCMPTCSSSSGNIQSCSTLDYPELDLNQIEND